MPEIVGKCYYCGDDVIHIKSCDFGAFSKRWIAEEQRYYFKNVWHMTCYKENMDIMLGVNKNDSTECK